MKQPSGLCKACLNVASAWFEDQLEHCVYLLEFHNSAKAVYK